MNMQGFTDERSLAAALEGTGMAAELIAKIVSSCRDGKTLQAKTLLAGYRQELLAGVHKSQDKLYRIDFIMDKWKFN